MKTKMIVKSLGLAAVMAASVSAFADGYDNTPRYGYPGGFPGYNNAPAYNNNMPAFNNQQAFQESLRMKNEVNERQDRQLDRVLSGFYDKKITLVEFRKLMDEQQNIRKMERGFLADGIMNRAEFQKLDAALDIANRNIFQQAHDDDDRKGRPGYGNNAPGWNPNGGYGYWGR